jgi:hypothetical protein
MLRERSAVFTTTIARGARAVSVTDISFTPRKTTLHALR